jgi:hypothetical protein
MIVYSEKGESAMSVYYAIYEHLIIEDTDKHFVVRNSIHRRLSLLAAIDLQRQGCVGTLEITADGRTYRLQGDIFAGELRRAMDALHRGQSVEVIVNYGCTVGNSRDEPTPFALLGHLDSALKEDAAYLEGLFYCVYTGDTLYAYGKKDGTLYTGPVSGACIDPVLYAP